MYDIFLSYSTQDIDRLRPLVNRLDAQGWSVFWDHRSIPVGKDWHDVIGDAISQCRCVVVAWSETSVDSKWVKEEALEGRKRDALFPVLLDNIDPPFGFGLIQAADLSHWNGKQNHPEFVELTEQLRVHLATQPELEDEENTTEPPIPFPDPKPTKISWLVSGLLFIASVVGGTAYYLKEAAPKQTLGFELSNTSEESELAKRPKTYPLIISTDPENAKITVDDKPYQPNMPILPGEHRISVGADNYQSIIKTITTEARKEQRHFALKPYRYALTINAKPTGAKVTFFDKDYEYKPGMLLPAGKYGVQLEKADYQLNKSYVYLNDKDETYTITLKPETTVIEPEMVKIKAGTFTMGCVEGRDDVAGGCDDDEKPAHQVTISKDFYMGKYEVTFDEWDVCEQAKVCPHADDEGWGRGKRPVINVSWEDTQTYINWLNKETGKTYRLPTEAEWEYAARAGSETAYPWGNSITCKNADFWSNNESCNSLGASPVGSYAANAFGLYDTVGNVWEWVADGHRDYTANAVTDPQGSGSARVVRGGSWLNRGRFVRSAGRDGRSPDLRSDLIGFRLALGH
jgi:formylglycine-generating enzyme required for sulfatase activity